LSFTQTLNTANRGLVSGFVLSSAYEGLGRREDAIQALNQAADERSPMVVFVKAEPIFDSMRGDPRFQALQKRLNLLK
jgi:hypothetical protein